MENTNIDKKRVFIINVLYYAVIVCLIHLGVKYVLNWIMPFVIGFIIAYILKPFINFISSKLKRIPKKLIASLAVIFFYTIILSVLFLIGWRIFDFTSDFIKKLPDTYTNYIVPAISKIGDFFKEIVNRFAPSLLEDVLKQSADWMKYLQTAVDKLSGAVAGGLGSAGKSMPGFITTLIFAVLSSVFITLDYQTITSGFLNIFPKNIRKGMFRFKEYFKDTAFKYIKAMGIVMGVTFVELCVGLFILRAENVFIIAALIAATDALPILGVGTVLLPWSLVELVRGNPSLALGLLILYIVIAVVRQIIEPRVVGQQLGIHPVLTLLCVYLGLKWMGFLGMIILLISTIIYVNYRKSGENPFIEQKPVNSAEPD